MELDIQQLRYFVEVTKEKSYTKAAKKLFVSQPALSKMIRKLESDLGIKLFDRYKRKIKLTDSGEILYKEAININRQFDNIVESVQDMKDLKKGHIITGMPSVLGTLYFAPIITRYQKDYPGIKLDIFEEGAKTVAMKVMEGSIDIGVVITPVDSEELVSMPVFKDENVVVVHKDHTLASMEYVNFTELKGERFNIFNENFVLHGQILSECRKAGFEPDVVFKSSQWDFIIEMLTLNQGISILPRPILLRTKYTDIITIPFQPAFPWEVTLIVRKDKYISHAMRVFIDYVKHFFREY